MDRTIKDDDDDDFLGEITAVKPFRPPNAEERRRKKTVSLIRTIAFLTLPTLISAIYLFFISSNIYAVNAIVMVRMPVLGAPSSSSSSSGTSMLGAMLGGGAGGDSSQTTTIRAVDESYAVVQFIQSQAAFRDIDQEINFRRAFSSSAIDWWHRLPKHATFLQTYNYYLDHTYVYYDDVQGQVLLTTYGFTPQMTLLLAHSLTQASETLVNQFNDRATHDYIALAEQQVAQKKQAWQDASDAVTNYQITNSIINPGVVSTSYNGIITALLTEAASLRAQIAAIPKIGGAESPQATPLHNQLKAVEAEIHSQQAYLTGSNDTVASKMAAFNKLTVSEQIAQGEYTSAVSNLDSELFDAKRQMLYVVNVVPPELPEQPQYPQRWKDLAIVFGITLGAWILLRILIAALKDHLA